ncbi:MAG: hypothetical protein ACJAW8_000490 [Oleispira sp.]|jgi:hypothetical protein
MTILQAIAIYNRLLQYKIMYMIEGLKNET